MIRKYWLSGDLPSNKVLEMSGAVAKHGAVGVGEFAHDDSRIAHRRLANAIGYPSSAPQHPIICPITVLEKMLVQQESFITNMQKDKGAIPDFWFNMRYTSLFQKSRGNIDPTRSTAVSLHGDGALIPKVDGLFYHLVVFAAWEGATRDTRMVHTVIPKRRMGGRGRCVRCVQGSRRSAIGRAIAVQVQAGCWLLDGTWRQSCCVGTGSSSHTCVVSPTSTHFPNMCWQCNATPRAGALCWTHSEADAGWRASLRDHQTYLAIMRVRGEEPPAVFGITTLKLEACMGDVMHTMDFGSYWSRGWQHHVGGDRAHAILRPSAS